MNMKLQRSTLILLLVALGLGGAVYLFEIRESQKQEKIATQQEQIFTFSQDDVQSFTVTIPDQTVTIERVGEENTDSPSPWKITSPVEDLANPASVNALVNQLVNSQNNPAENISLRRLTIDATELSSYGLENPEKTVEVTLKDNQTHRLVFGQLDFNGESIYAQIDPESTPEKTSILVIPKGILTPIDQPLDDWKLPETAAETETEESNASDVEETVDSNASESLQ